MTELESLLVRLVGDGSSYQAMLNQAQVSTKQAAQQVEAAAGRIQGLGNSLQGFGQNALGVLGQLGVAMSIGGIVTQAVKMAAETERMEVSFGVMLGNMKDGASMVKELQVLAANTPFELPTLLSSTKMLLQFGVVAEDIMPTLKMLGDVSGGDAAKMSSLSYAFGQITSTGRLMGQDLLQLINAGFNPLQEISKKTGRSMAELKADMEKGAISAEMVKTAFKDATSEGGRFFGFMEKSSQDVMGLFSTMKDDIGGALRELGFELIESLNLKEAIKAVSIFAKQVTEFFKGLPPDVKKFLGLLIGITGAVAAASAAYLLFSPLVTATYATAAAGVTKFIGLLTVQTAASTATWAAYAAGAALAVAAALGVAYAGYKIGESLREIALPESLLQDMKDYNEETDRSIKLNADLSNRFAKQTDAILKQAESLKDTEKKSFLETQLEAAKKEMGGYESGLRNATKQVEEQDGLWSRWTGSKMLEMTRKDAEEAAFRLEIAKKRVEELQGVLKAEQAPAQDAKALADLKKLTEKYEEQARTIGLTGVEAEIAKAKLDQMPASQLENLRAMAAMTREAAENVKQQQALAESAEKFKEELQTQSTMFGLSAGEAKIKRFEMEGLDEAELSMFRTMVKANKEQEERAKLMKEGMETTKKYMTPMEKFKERMDELDKQLAAGGLSQGAYTLAVSEARKELDEQGKSAAKTRSEIEKLEAVLTGSAEASRRISAYQEMLRGGKMMGTGVARSDDAEIRRKAGERANRIRDMREELFSGLARTQDPELLKGLNEWSSKAPKLFTDVIAREVRQTMKEQAGHRLALGVKPEDFGAAGLDQTWRQLDQMKDQVALGSGMGGAGQMDPRWRELLETGAVPEQHQARIESSSEKQTVLLAQAVDWLKDIAKKGGVSIGSANL